MSKLSQYIKDSIGEMKKVTWPTKKETRNYTFLVIGISVGVALFLGLLDWIFEIAFKVIVTK
jgi:preprotein translocase subunit SecE